MLKGFSEELTSGLIINGVILTNVTLDYCLE